MDDGLSEEASKVLGFAFERGGQSPLAHAVEAAHEAMRAGLIELVTLGVDEPLVVLTPAGLKRCRADRPKSGWALPRLFRAAAHS